VTKDAYLSHGLSQSEVAMAAANELKKAKYPQPDTAQMLPFKPVRNACKYLILQGHLFFSHNFKLE